jgi:hypothetical protein
MDHPFSISPYWSAGSGLGSGRSLDVLGAELMRYGNMPYKYRVITECSSKEDADIDVFGRQILLTTNNYQDARKECIEWAAYDDILVHVVNQFGSIKFSCDGATEAWDRYPKTAELV